MTSTAEYIRELLFSPEGPLLFSDDLIVALVAGTFAIILEITLIALVVNRLQQARLRRENRERRRWVIEQLRQAIVEIVDERDPSRWFHQLTRVRSRIESVGSYIPGLLEVIELFIDRFEVRLGNLPSDQPNSVPYQLGMWARRELMTICDVARIDRNGKRVCEHILESHLVGSFVRDFDAPRIGIAYTSDVTETKPQNLVYLWKNWHVYFRLVEHRLMVRGISENAWRISGLARPFFPLPLNVELYIVSYRATSTNGRFNYVVYSRFLGRLFIIEAQLNYRAIASDSGRRVWYTGLLKHDYSGWYVTLLAHLIKPVALRLLAMFSRAGGRACERIDQLSVSYGAPIKGKIGQDWGVDEDHEYSALRDILVDGGCIEYGEHRGPEAGSDDLPEPIKVGLSPPQGCCSADFQWAIAEAARELLDESGTVSIYPHIEVLSSIRGLGANADVATLRHQEIRTHANVEALKDHLLGVLST